MLIVFLVIYLNIFMADKNIRKYKIWRTGQNLNLWDAIRHAANGKIIIESKELYTLMKALWDYIWSISEEFTQAG